MALTRAYEASLKAVPLARDHFVRCLETAEENRHPSTVHDLWITLVQRCKQCYEVSEALHLRLTNMRKDVDGRNDPSFWLLCRTFLQHFIALVNEMREVRNMRLLPQELIVMLRPVQKASREAGRLMESSPWKNLADGISMVPAPTPYTSAMGQRYDSGDFSQLMDAALAKIDWDGFPTRRAEAARRGRQRGIGLAYYLEATGGAATENAKV
ncbi:MAG: RAM signaling network component, partial [Watsoniomyces obsoletus]